MKKRHVWLSHVIFWSKDRSSLYRPPVYGISGRIPRHFQTNFKFVKYSVNSVHCVINIDDGWHNKLNQNVNAGGLNLYLLIKRLHEEATCGFGARTDHALPENHVSQTSQKNYGTVGEI